MNLKFLLPLMQLTMAIPVNLSWQNIELEHAVEDTMMNMDVIMAALANYEKEQRLIEQTYQTMFKVCARPYRFGEHTFGVVWN